MVHEWALAESIVLYVLSRGIKKAKKVAVKIGVLQSIDKDILVFAVRELSKEYGLEIGEVEVVDEEPVFKCHICGYTWSLNMSEVEEPVREAVHFLPEAAYAYFKCPNCRSIDFEIVKGRGLSGVVVEGYE
ncbi:MAG: hydrogenase nickel incorporation protein HypA [Desulfurococcaceae archaeon]